MTGLACVGRPGEQSSPGLYAASQATPWQGVLKGDGDGSTG